jgi:succinate-acetate transporter protein
MTDVSVGRRSDVTGGISAEIASAIQHPRPVTADPAPLGLGAFALTTFVLSMMNSGLVSDAGIPVVLGLALAYGGAAQLLAGMWEFRTGNTFGATAFTSFGAFWISYFVLVQFDAASIPSAHAGKSIGLYLIAWGIFTAYMFVASLRTTGAVALVFLLLTLTFLALGIGEARASDTWTHLGGWLGLATAIVAWYTSFANVLNSTFGRILLPVVPLGRE